MNLSIHRLAACKDTINKQIGRGGIASGARDPTGPRHVNSLSPDAIARSRLSV